MMSDTKRINMPRDITVGDRRIIHIVNVAGDHGYLLGQVVAIIQGIAAHLELGKSIDASKT